MKKIIKGKEARKKLLEGVTLVYDAVSTTLGPKSANVAISRQWGAPKIVHDGVTVAREVGSADEQVNMGVLLAIETAAKTVLETGDGTTTSIVLLYELCKLGNDMIEQGEVNAIQLRDQLDAAYKKLLPHLQSLAIKTNNTDDIKKVATISSTQEDIGALVAEGYKKVGLSGIVTADINYGNNDVIESTEGMQFDTGYASPYFINNPDKMDATVDEPYILVIDKPLSHQNELLPALKMIDSVSRNIVIVGDLVGSALSVCIKNKMAGQINCIVITPPHHGMLRKEYLEDIGVLTGARVLTSEIGFDIKNFDLAWCGRADKVYATSARSTIIGGRGEKRLIEKHLENIKYKKENPSSEPERERYEERYAKLTTGVVVIRVGGKTEIIQNERLERLKDAIGSARAALEEGIVAGGGITYLRLKDKMKAKTTGENLLLSILDKPIRKILENAGEDKESIENILDNIEDFKDRGIMGYEMNSGNIVDMVKQGVIDPVKVLRVALENAVSVAGSILTTEVLIAQKIEPLVLQ